MMTRAKRKVKSAKSAEGRYEQLSVPIGTRERLETYRLMLEKEIGMPVMVGAAVVKAIEEAIARRQS